MKVNLKKTIFHVSMLCFFLLISAGCLFEGSNRNTSEQKDYSITQVEDGNTFLKLNISINEYGINTKTIDGITYSTIDFNGDARTDEQGFASLPILKTSVELPPNANISNEIASEEFIDVALDFPLLPSKGKIYRNQDPSEIPYEIAPESLDLEWYPEETINMTEPYILRDIRGTNVYVNPFVYNANTQTLRIFKNITISFIENDSETINMLSRSKLGNKIVAEMDDLYKSMFINYSRSAARAVAESGEMLVIYTARDETAIQPYIQWKKEKGFKVTTAKVATGTNVKNTVKNAYNANNNILYVQLVGDWEDIKSDLGTSEKKPMDPILGCVTGSDKIPDLIVGRFSAQNSAEVTVQVNKAINYEKNPDLNGDWYSNALGIGSSEGPGDDNELDIEHVEVINNIKLPTFTYTSSSTTEYSKNNTKSEVANILNNSGASLINYVGHGSPKSWGTTGFDNNSINSLNNGSKLPVIISVACVNGEFLNSYDSFAETWLKKQNGGAVATVMSTINQSWEPPMRGQDYMNDLLVGGWDYKANPGSGSGTNTTSGRTTFGSIVLNGSILMDDQETMSTWTIFGDSSLQVRTSKPKQIILSNQTVESNMPFKTTVKSGNEGQSAVVTISQGNKFYTATTNSSGEVSINHNLSSGKAKLVVTGQNLETKYITINVSGTGGESSFSISASAGNNGSINPSGNINVNKGENQSFSITPASCYAVDSVMVDGDNIGPVLSYTFTNLQADHSINVSFKPISCEEPDNSIPLNNWIPNNLDANETKWFYFDAEDGKNYKIHWDDAYEGSGKYTGNDIVVSCYQADKTTSFFHGVDSGYKRPKSIVAQRTEKIYLKVVGYYQNESASYSLKVESSESNSNSTVYFKALANNKYVCATDNGDSPLIAINTSIESCTTFDLISNNDGTVSLKAKINGKFVSIGNDGSSKLIANSVSIRGNTEKFTLVKSANGKVSFKSKANGQYVKATYKGKKALKAKSSSIGTYEQFIIDNTGGVNEESSFSISASAGNHGSIDPWGSIIVDQGADQSFSFVPAPGYSVDSVIINGQNIGSVTSYTFKNVQSNQNITVSFTNKPKPIELGAEPSTYLSYNEIVDLMTSWADAGPEIMEVGTYGGDNEYDNYYLRISAAVSDKSLNLPTAQINSCIHGDEWIATASVMGAIHRFIANYGKDNEITTLIQTRDIYIIPVVNPKSYDKKSRYEGGKDPNRTFPGPAAPNNNPTPNVQRLMDFFVDIEFNSILEYHASGRMAMIPWAYTYNQLKEGDHGDKHRYLVKKLGEAANYDWGSIPEMVGYTVVGDSGDWAYTEGQKRGFNTSVFGVEAGKSKIPSKSAIPKEVNNNYNLIVAFIAEGPTLLDSRTPNRGKGIVTPIYETVPEYFVPGLE